MLSHNYENKKGDNLSPFQTSPRLTLPDHTVSYLASPLHAAPSPLIGSKDIIPYLQQNGYKILSIDLNNVLMDQISGIVRASKGRLIPADFATWDADNSHKMGMTRDQYLAWAWQNPYSELLSPAFPNADRQLFRLKRAGIAIWIVTATVLSEKEIAGWLWCNGIFYDKIIKTNDKMGIGDIMIDDSPSTCAAFYEAGLPILRYELAWNEHLSHVPGVRW